MPVVHTHEPRLVVGLSSNVLESHDAAARPDGIGTYTYELEQALSSEGALVRRIGAPVRVGTRFVRPRNAALCFPLPLAYMTAASSVLRVNVPLPEAIGREIDLYHATDYMVPRFARKPVVATLYDAIPLTHPEWANPRLRRIKNWLLRECAHAADAAIAISNAAAQELTEHYRIPPERIRVVPLGVHARWFAAPDAAEIEVALARHRLRRGYILHVGTLQPRKNLDALVTAYERLPESVRRERQLVLVGKYGWRAHALRARLESLKPQGRVIWLDYVERDQLRALYHAAGMFVFPSLSEGFGLPVLEAFACGLPVIASDLPALREVAGPRATWIEPKSTDAIADAIGRLHDLDADSATRALRREHARGFTWRWCAETTMAV
jgi:glycosyltransferase involved in cell wall biosynthesis